MSQIKILETKDIPEGKKIGKESQVPELLAKIPKGKTGAITNTYKELNVKTDYGTEGQFTLTHTWETKDTPKIGTIRSYIEKQHKTGKNKDYTIVQRGTINTDGTKTITLYITHEGKKN